MDEYVGMLPLAKLLTSDPSVTVREIMASDMPAIHVIGNGCCRGKNIL